MARTIVHVGRKIKVALDESPGRDGQLVRRDIILHPGAVAILPLLDEDHLCLLRNRRPVVGDTLLEIPAGTLEPGEDPDLAAHRELAEETGYRAGRMDKLHRFFPSPGVIDEATHLYVARELVPGEMRLELDEDLEPIRVAWTQALSWVMDGTIRDAKTLVAVLLWQRLREGGLERLGSL
ncbi:MAG: NUDIX hydrolase [Gemmataceae bacterium]